MCPDENTLNAMLQGFLGASDLEAVQRHLDTCEACMELMIGLVDLVEPVVGAPSRIGRYELLSELGAGAQGIVHEAYDPQLKRRVALKRVEPAETSDPGRLQREARALAALSHAHVVPVFEIGTCAQGVYMVTELMGGGTVRSWGHQPRPWREVVALYLGIGRGLAAAHAAGLVHRDVKPDNLLLHGDGRAMLADFGLASAAPGLDGTAGSPAYMAPELLGGAIADARSDQFAFCVSLFETLCGRLPFEGRSLGELRAAMEAGLPARRCQGVPRRIGRVLRRGMSADPAARYPDMVAVVEALSQACARPAPGVLLAVGVAIVGIGVGLGLLGSGGRRVPLVDEPAAALGEPVAVLDVIAPGPRLPAAAPAPAVIDPVPLPPVRPRSPRRRTAPEPSPCQASADEVLAKLPCASPACRRSVERVVLCQDLYGDCDAFARWIEILEDADAPRADALRSTSYRCPPPDPGGRLEHFLRFGFHELSDDADACLALGVQIRGWLSSPGITEAQVDRLWGMQLSTISVLEHHHGVPAIAHAEAERARAAFGRSPDVVPVVP